MILTNPADEALGCHQSGVVADTVQKLKLWLQSVAIAALDDMYAGLEANDKPKFKAPDEVVFIVMNPWFMPLLVLMD